MKQLGWTSIKQSKKLIEAGLIPTTSDMTYRRYKVKCKYEWFPECVPYNHWLKKDEDGCSMDLDNVKPCWSLGALIGLVSLPLFITHDDEWFVTFDLSTDASHQFSSKTLIDALCKAIEWLVENNYIKKGD